MDEDFPTQKSKRLSQSLGDIEVQHEEGEEVELSPVETIVWDCTEVNIFFNDESEKKNWINYLMQLGIPREKLAETAQGYYAT